MYSLTEKLRFIESVFERGKLDNKGENFSVRCPICKPHDQSKRKLTIHLYRNVVHCWVCDFKSRSILPLLYRFASKEKVAEYLEKFADGDTALREECVLEQKSIRLPEDFQLLASHWNTTTIQYANFFSYLKRRQLELSDLWKWQMGISFQTKYQNRVIVPSFDQRGELNFIVARAIEDKFFPRYMNSNNDSKDIIFNEYRIDWTKRLNIVEGPFDVFNCPENTTCLLGSFMSEESLLFDRILQYRVPVVFCLDDDATIKMHRYCKLLYSYNIPVFYCTLNKYHDPGSMPRDEAREMFAAAQPWTWETYMQNKILRAIR